MPTAASDPRLPEGALTLNEELLRGSIRHAIYIQRVKARLARETVGFLNDQVFPDALEKLVAALDRIGQRGPGSGLWTARRYLQMVKDLDEIVTGGIADAHSKLERLLRDAARIEAAFTVKHIADTAPVQITLGLPSARTLNTLVSTRPIDGSTLESLFDNMAQGTRTRVMQQVNIGLTEGESVTDIARRIRGTRDGGFRDGVLQTTRREAERIARTAASSVSSMAREEVYAANDDVISGYMWVATLSPTAKGNYTCILCASRDGQVYEVGKGPRPPAHPDCRCSDTPVLRSWRELGIDLDEAPEGTRASANGQVPASLSLEEFLKDEPDSVQDRALGPTRAALWRSGELEFVDFLDDRGGLIPLSELARREGIELPAQYRN